MSNFRMNVWNFQTIDTISMLILIGSKSLENYPK